MAIIYVDNRPYEVDGTENLLHACLSAGLDVPFFCWHPALKSVGACRQCAVKQFKDENDRRGRIVMSCMTPVTEGARISIDDPEAKAFRKNVIEWLMINHPHDCPVCDEGGECHLQDMTVMAGHTYRRYRFPKRTYRNQYLGPFVAHEMNRCIQCYRCVRFYRDYAGGNDLNVFGCHDQLYFGRAQDGTLESEFSGNLVEVCPTGVFTDATFKNHYVRKWDLQMAPSICVHCSVGCNIIPSERQGMLRRIRNRFNSEVNGYFLCDRGRFAYEFVNGSQRISHSFRREKDGERNLNAAEVLSELKPLIADKERLIGIGSARASLEANFLLRELVGADRFSTGLAGEEADLTALALAILKTGPSRAPSLSELSQADAVLILGEDVTNTAPMMALALRQTPLANEARAQALGVPRWQDQAYRLALGEKATPFYVAASQETKLDDIATRTLRLLPGAIADFAFAVAAHGGMPGKRAQLSAEYEQPAQEIARALQGARRPAIVTGLQMMSRPLLEAAANVAQAVSNAERPAMLAIALPECNSLGVQLLGGLSLHEASKKMSRGGDTVIVLENDLAGRSAEGAAIVEAAKTLIVVDHTRSATTAKARLVLAAATYAESDGTLVNYEGRAQRFIRVLPARAGAQESWRWLLNLRAGNGDSGEEKTFRAVQSAMAASDPLWSPLTELLPDHPAPIPGRKVARQPHRFSGRTALTADVSVFEPRPPQDRDSPLSFSMEGYQGYPPAPVVPFFWSPGWNSEQATLKYQTEAGGVLHGGPAGKRLLEPAAAGRSWFQQITPPAAGDDQCFSVFRIARIFGSEELSNLSPPVAERIPADCVALHPEDAAALGLAEGEQARISAGSHSIVLPVSFAPAVARGSAGFFVRAPHPFAVERRRPCTITKYEGAS